MSLSRLAPVLALSGCVAASAVAQETRCPARKDGAALANVDLFDGPPSEHADLAPDDFTDDRQGGHSDWDVGYVFKDGRKLFVKCDYGAQTAALVLEAPASTKHCVFRPGKGAGASLICSAN